ncbi:GNAT family N-acetyltransferase [Seonamhaeicola sp.]|uniref:GNAT family N-acetyltransferase n=1 Tax=Seonamhaeicola sp. TaxID=1912245 RepID=UPI00261BC5CD|nr:GNAT family N-acetyltransferase [Seonamhaeicola sp.]
MIKLVRTNSKNEAFIALVNLLNGYLKTVDGTEHDFYMQYNNIDVLNHVVIAYHDSIPVGCGAFKKFDDDAVEIKRMFTLPEYRGKGVATLILKELETWAKEARYNICVLETGKRQIEAVNFYKKKRYQVIPNYGPYKDIANSLCFKKILS